MAITYITVTDTGELIRAKDETYIDAARWALSNGLNANDILFSATPPRHCPPRVRFDIAIPEPRESMWQGMPLFVFLILAVCVMAALAI